MNQKRLRDQIDSSDADVGVAAALVASATRLAPSEARKERVRTALDAQRRRRPIPRVRTAFTLAAIIATSAALAHVLPRLAHVLSRRSQPPAAQSRPTPPPAVAPTVEEPAPPAPEPTPVKRRRHVVAALPTPANAEEEAASLLVAVQALRRDHDAALALTRLDAYFDHFPNGALHEEALGLGIEAATTLGDARAADYAARYLEGHPDGRFRAAAQRALQRLGSKEETP